MFVFANLFEVKKPAIRRGGWRISRSILVFITCWVISAFIVIGVSATPLVHKPHLQTGECPSFEITSKFSFAYGDILLNGMPAPLNTVVTARSPRGDVIGCFIVGSVGIYGTIRIYGEDNSVTPTLPGMRPGEIVSFYADNIPAVSSPTLVWQDDHGFFNEVDLTAEGEPVSIADFSAAPLSGYPPLTVAFSDLSQGNLTQWNWAFGDGTASTLQNPSHIYQQAGSYTVSLTVQGPGGSNTKTRVDYVTVSPNIPSADFSADPSNGVAPLAVNFTNLSTHYSVSLWSFGDQTTSSETNPSHIFAQPGIYSVSLVVVGLGGSDTETKTDYIRVFTPVQAGFSADVTSGVAPLTVQFTDTSSGDWTTLAWDFGDGGSSTATNPAHIYTTPGTYTVALTATGPGGSDTETMTGFVQVYAPVQAGFSADVTSGAAPMTVQFTNTSSGDWTTLAWDFGDGGSSTETNPAHTYNTPGIYTVALTAAGPGGSDTETMAGFVQVTAPVQAAFSADVTSGAAPLTVQFTNTSSGDWTTLAWDFGDGGNSTEINPVHTYTVPGSYTVSLTAYGALSQSTETRSGYIVVSELMYDDIFKDGFESGDLSAWSSSATDGGVLSASPAAAMVGGFGMQATIDDNTPIVVRDDSPVNETGYRARFYFDPNSISMADYDMHSIFLGYNNTTHILVVDFRRFPGGSYQVRVLTLDNNGVWRISSFYTITDGPNFIEIDWRAATAQDANDGYLKLFINGVERTTLSGIDNDTRRIERAALGPAMAIDNGTRGTYFFDAFESRRASYIGAAGVRADFTANPTSGIAPLTVSFTSLAEPADKITSYLWDFGDGQTSSEVSPSHVYPQDGEYTVSLTVGGDGDTDTLTRDGYIQVSDLIFADWFETGDLSAWSSSVTDGGDLSVTPAAALVGGFGMQATIDDNTPIVVRDDSPDNLAHYRARFYFDPNSITMADYDMHSIFLGYTSTIHILVVDFRKFPGGSYQLRALTLDDNGVWRISSFFTITDSPHFIELDWQAASAQGANDGYLTLFIDGVERSTLSGIDNDTRRIERAAIGAAMAIDSGTIGTYFFDAFESRRASYIGAAGVRADFSASPTTGLAPLTVSFTSLAEPAGKITSYLWDFGDGQTSTDPNPSHVYTTHGDYTVSLTVGGDGDSDTLTRSGLIHIPDLVFADGFESGGLSAWSSSITDGGDLSVSPAAALVGSFGLQATIDDNTPIVVRDDSPANEARYRARFYFDPNSIAMADYDMHSIFLGYSSTIHILVIDFRKFPDGSYQLRALTLDDNGVWRISSFFTITDGPHFIELDWQAASAIGANDGYLTLFIDGVERTSLAGIDNDTRRIERAALGPAMAIDSGTRGTYFFDAFESRRASYIGVAGVRADFSASPTFGSVPLTVSFTSLAEPADKITSYLWDFGDGQTSMQAHPQHTYTIEGDYTVSLTVSGDGDTDTLTRAGYIHTSDLVFADGFESEGLSAWSSSVTDSGDLGVSPAAALVGGYGMQATIDDNTPIVVRDDSPDNLARYRLRFYFDPNSISMADYDMHSIFLGYSSTTHILVIDFRKYPGGYQVRALTLTDSGTWRISSFYTITDNPHYIELDWQAASTEGANDGYLTLFIDGVERTTLSGIDNDTRRIERAALGPAMAIDNGTRGTYFFDAFESRRINAIGADPAAP